MQSLLRDARAQRQVETDGYTIVRLFSPAQVEALLDLYHRHVAAPDVTGLYESSRHNPYEVNRRINETIRDHVVSAAADLLGPARVLGGTFMVKSHRDSDVLPLHQDWSVVEEDRYATLFLWAPLVDVSRRNGGLFVVPGSHRYFDVLRSGSYPSNRYTLPVAEAAGAVDVPLAAGDAILYSDALFHGSYANHGFDDRVVVTARIMEEYASLVYYQRVNANEADVHAVDEAFFLTHIGALAKGEMPPGQPVIRRRAYVHVPVTVDTLCAKIRQHRGVPRQERPMQRLFRDDARQREFDERGFVVLDLIGPDVVSELTAFHDRLQHAPTPAGGFQVSLDNADPTFVREVSETLMRTVGPAVERYLMDHQIFTASFVTKSTSPLGVVPPHQDWTFVDESTHWSATVWCPLIDVTLANGALGLVAGSHRLYDHVRPSPSPQYRPPFSRQLYDLGPYLTVPPLQAGQAVMFDNRTLHASPPNTTGRTRVAFGLGVTHREATLRHYYLLPNQPTPLVEGFEVDREFFWRYNNARLSELHARGERPRDLSSLGTFALVHREYSTPDLVAAVRAAGNRPDAAIEQALVSLRGDDETGRPATAAAATASPVLPFWRVYTPGNVVREIRHRLRRA
jgi:ectoine hydroxylase-related dioxygenase (phytanoyl-CoA dioxygenase family)